MSKIKFSSCSFARRATVAVIAAIACQGAIGQTYTSWATVDGETVITTDPAYETAPDGSYASALAGSAVLEASTYVTPAFGPGYIQGSYGDAKAGREVNDWAVSGSGGTTTGALWFHLQGVLQADIANHFTGDAGGHAQATLSANVTDLSTGSHIFTGLLTFAEDGIPGTGTQVPSVSCNGGTSFQNVVNALTANQTDFGAGIAAVASGTDIYTDPFTWTAGDTYDVNVSLETYVIANGSYHPMADESLFGHTLTFATDHTVLDLPAGWTVNSPESEVVNNHFAGVPEPGTFAALAFGAAAFARRRRSRIR